MSDYPEVRYQEIQETLPTDLQNRVLTVLQAHIGRANRITRKMLVSEVFNVSMTDVELSNSTIDRQVRMVMADLQRRFPILSTSGGGGYYYASNAEEIARYAAEINSRAMKLLDKSRQLEKQAAAFQRDIQLKLL